MKRNYIIKVSALLLLLVPSCRYSATEIKRGKHITGSEGMVVSAHPLASLAGAEILIQGGNAFDAAAATSFALAVCYPTAGNIGGGSLIVLRESGGTYRALDCREKAPMAASSNMYLDPEGRVISGMSTSTRAASGVPGSVAGILEMLDKYGSMPLDSIIQPAVDMARYGFPITEKQAGSLNRSARKFKAVNFHDIPFIKDSSWKKGDTLIQEDLAGTLERIRDNGRDGFYKGLTADLIVAEMKKGNGLIVHNDLENYNAVWRQALKGSYKGYGIISMPPPSSGGVALLQLLGIMENFLTDPVDFHSPRHVHLITEAERRVYADRTFYLGDPDYVSVPLKEMIKKEYLLSRMQNYNPDEASLSSDIEHGKVPVAESEETTHLSVVDRHHNAVALTTTLNSGYGNGVVVEGAGFILNNEMDDFSSKPGYPNIYGLIGGEANSIKPGKRMLSSMTPTIVDKDNKLCMVLGSPGGSTIITSVFQTIINVIDYGMNMKEAVDAPRFHHQWMPDLIYFEKEAADSSLLKQLDNMGHKYRVRSPIGRVDAIRITDNGNMEAGADRRGDDTACGY